jgi:hypothetical protein
MSRLRNNKFHFHYEHAAYDGRHSEWSVEPRKTKILTFLQEQFFENGRTNNRDSKIESTEK